MTLHTDVEIALTCRILLSLLAASKEVTFSRLTVACSPNKSNSYEENKTDIEEIFWSGVGSSAAVSCSI